MDPALVIFAIQAGIKLGRKVNDVLVDQTQARALLLPTGWLGGIDASRTNALEYFRRHRQLTRAGGPYAGLTDDEKVEAYQTIIAVQRRIDGREEPHDAAEVIIELQRFEQFKEGFGPQSPLKRILGTIVEIGIDYFAANPRLIEGDSPSTERKLLQAFVANLDEIDFAEAASEKIVGDLFRATLTTLSDHPELASDDKRINAIVGGISSSLLGDLDALTSPTAAMTRENLIKRAASSILRGAASAFSENIDLFIPKDSTAKTLVGSTLSQVVKGIEGKEDLFTNESIELIFKSALRAVGENAQLFSDEAIVQDLISNTISALTQGQGGRVFSEDTVAAIVQGALEAVRDNVETLIDINQPEKQLLAAIIKSVANGLSTNLAGGGDVRSLLSKDQLVDLVKLSFFEVANHAELLLDVGEDDSRKLALAQIISSVARAIGDDPKRLVNGEGFVELVEIAIGVAVKNADKLLDLDSITPRRNLLFKVLQQVVTGLLEAEDRRKLISREVFLDIAGRVLPLVSANLDPLLGDSPDIVKQAVAKSLELANGVLENRVNGENLPALIEGMLREVLWGELNLDESNAVLKTATDVLKAA